MEEAPPDDLLADAAPSDMPDYLECLKQARKEEKELDELLAQGKLPPAMAAAEAKAERKRKKKLSRAIKAVYITGLPPDTDVEELADFVTKYAGIIEKDPETRQRKVKLYTDAHGTFAGEALVEFFRPESVEQAMTLVAGMEYAPGFVLAVQKTKRTKKEPGAQKKRVPDKRIKRYDQEKNELGWDEEEEKRNVILKGMFTLEEAREGGFDFFDDLKRELEEELSKLGNVKGIKIFEHNPEGVVAVKYETGIEAQRCLARMDGRFFDGRTIGAEFYDGFTNYEVKETDEDRERRLRQFGKWLGAAEDDEGPAKAQDDDDAGADAWVDEEQE